MPSWLVSQRKIVGFSRSVACTTFTDTNQGTASKSWKSISWNVFRWHSNLFAGKFAVKLFPPLNWSLLNVRQYRQSIAWPLMLCWPTRLRDISSRQKQLSTKSISIRRSLNALKTPIVNILPMIISGEVMSAEKSNSTWLESQQSSTKLYFCMSSFSSCSLLKFISFISFFSQHFIFHFSSVSYQSKIYVWNICRFLSESLKSLPKHG